MGKVIKFKDLPKEIKKEKRRKAAINRIAIWISIIAGVSAITGITGVWYVENCIGTQPEATGTPSPTIPPSPTPVPDWQTMAEAYNNEGLDLYNLGQYEDAIKKYDSAITLEEHGIEDMDVCYYNRGRAYYKLGNYEKAVGDYTIAIGINPRTKYYSDRAEAYRALGDEANAAIDDAKAIMDILN